jgi:hypothetical protein
MSERFNGLQLTTQDGKTVEAISRFSNDTGRILEDGRSEYEDYVLNCSLLQCPGCQAAITLTTLVPVQ